MKRLFLFLVAMSILLPTSLTAKAPMKKTPILRVFSATVKDPDGFTNLREKPTKNSPIIGKILVKEVFLTCDRVNDWFECFSSKGILGYVHASRVVILPNTPENSFKTHRNLLDDVSDDCSGAAKGAGFDYLECAKLAISGDEQSHRKVLSITCDVEAHSSLVWHLLPHLGDQKFATAVKGLSKEEKEMVWTNLTVEFACPIGFEKEVNWDGYYSGCFPLTYKELTTK